MIFGRGETGYVYNFTAVFTNEMNYFTALDSFSKLGKDGYLEKKKKSTVIGYAPGSNLPYLLQQNKCGASWTCNPVQHRVPSAAHTPDVS